MFAGPLGAALSQASSSTLLPLATWCAPCHDLQSAAWQMSYVPANAVRANLAGPACAAWQVARTRRRKHNGHQNNGTPGIRLQERFLRSDTMPRTLPP